jgi:aldose 1-epimerase
MFKIIKKPFGKFSKIRLSNEKTGEYVSIIPEFGANVNEIVLSKNGELCSLVDGDKTFEELIKNDWYKGAKLVPFPNRINDGKYSFESNQYQLDINFPSQHHAIHGLVYNKEFSLRQANASKNAVSVELWHNYTGENKGYPFHFSINITYSLSDKGFECQTIIKNIDSRNIPMADGWHPYFKLDEKVDNLYLRLPSSKKILVDKNMIPDGKIDKFGNFKRLTKIEGQNFDDGFSLSGRIGIARTEIYNEEKKLMLVVWQETGKMKYNYLQVFIPPDRESIAIEPMTSIADAFNNKKGLIVLKPNDEFKAKYGVFLKQ